MTSNLQTRLAATLSGQYAIEHELGGGGMSRVFVANERELGRRVVIKVLPEEVTGGVSARRFEREIKLAAALQQANIVPVLSAGSAEGLPYYTMPFVEGLSLRDRLRQEGRLPHQDTLGILRDVGRALTYAHERGVVHRDIKPENVLLSGGAAVVTDFGIAKAIANARESGEKRESGGSTVTLAGTAVGTPAYMAPEQISGNPDIDHRADLYSFGCMAYELVTGEVPFGKRPMHALFSAHLSELPRPVGEVRPDCPPLLARMIMRCLEKNPAQRPQSAGELVSTMDAASATATRIQQFTQGLSRRQRFAVSALLVLVATAAGAAVIRGRVTDSGRIRSLAVLPLETLSGDSSRQYVADGLHEALINRLSQIDGVQRVISRRSVMRYRTPETPLPQIARELGVHGFVTASLQFFGDSVRVTANLIRATDERQMWSDRYLLPLRDIMTVEEDVVAAIRQELGIALTDAEESRIRAAATINPAAYEDYMKGRFYLTNTLSSADLEIALQYFESALRKQPDYAAAYAGIATVWSFKGTNLQAPFEEARTKARAAASRAIQLDSLLFDAQLMQAQLLFGQEWDYPRSDSAARMAIAINPSSADARSMYSVHLMAQLRPREAIAQVEKAIELEPWSSGHQLTYAYILGQMRRYDDAITQAQKAMAMSDVGDDSFGHEIIWRALHMKGDTTLTLARAESLYKTDVEALAVLRQGRDAGGYREANRRVADLLAAHAAKRTTNGQYDFWAQEHAAIMYAMAGEKSRAMDMLDMGYERRHAMMSHIAADPHWDVLRSEQRFHELVRRMKLPQTTGARS